MAGLLANDEPALRVRIFYALQGLAKEPATLAAVLACAASTKKGVRLAALELVAKRFATRPRSLDAWQSALSDPDSSVVVLAAEQLVSRGRATDALVAACIQVLSDSDTSFWDKAKVIEVIGQCGNLARPAIPQLLLALDDQYTAVQAAIVSAFAALSVLAEATVPGLVERAGEGNGGAVAALVALEPRAGELLSDALRRLDSARRAAIETAMQEERRDVRQSAGSDSEER